MNRRVVLIGCLALVAATLPALAPPAEVAPAGKEAEASLERAESLRAEGSYARALEVYEALAATELSSETRRWVEFRVADVLWRAEASTDNPDTTRLDRARHALEVLVRDVTREPDRDRVWAEVQESLGDWSWTRRGASDWGTAWNRYSLALDWWAGSTDIDLARKRYLDIVWKASRPAGVDPRRYVYGSDISRIPATILDNAASIAVDPADRARASYLVAMAYRNRGGDEAARRVDEAFATAANLGRGTAWHDDALFHWADWLARVGPGARDDDGTCHARPDYVRAVAVFRRLVTGYREGETRFRDDALRRIEEITAPTVGVAVSSFFLPGSQVGFQLGWRNVASVKLSLYAVDLTEDVRMSGDLASGQWLDALDLENRAPLRSWSRDTGDRGDHVPGRDAVELDEPLPAGAFVLEAVAGKARSRDLVLVSGASLVLKTSPTRALVYACDAVSGAPRSGATVTLWARSRHERDWRWERVRATAGDDGLAVLPLPPSTANHDVFVAVAADGDQAYAQGWGSHAGSRSDDWRIYAFTDRPAYRPGERVHWKMVARRHRDGRYATPAGERVEYEIRDPRGGEVVSGTLELNRFGSAWDSLELGESLPLGEFRVTFWSEGRGRALGSGTLFRLEEYKLPEFRVEVRTPEIDGRPQTFRVGETVRAEVAAEFYFGGPVAGAQVEAVVYQRPLFVAWRRPREFPWFYDDMDGRGGWWGGPGRVVHRESVVTDADGHAVVEFDTPDNASQDFEYTVEARVTDASRREIVGTGTVRASRQRYFAFAEPEHRLYRPGDEVRVTVRTVDAGDRPLAAEGRVTVTRERWVEVWIDPRGREVTGDALEKIRSRGAFPPAAPPGDPAWRPKFRGYESENVLDRLVRTGDDGEAEVAFASDRAGFYRVVWSGDDGKRYPVRAEATVWVADEGSVDVGYHHGGVGIIVDRDTFEAGRLAPVMLTSPVRDAWVLFTVESEDLLDHRLVHLTGTVKLIELPVDERYVPNVFLDAAMVHDGELLLDSRQVVVPPVEHFLEVEVAGDREEYLPRETGTLTVTTRDRDGRPVAAEVGLGLIDASVLYVQDDYAGDPRPFFFGTKRGKLVRTTSTFHQRRLARPGSEDEAPGIIEADYRERQDRDFVIGDPMAAKSAVAEGRVADEVGGAREQRQAFAPSAAEPPAAEPTVQVRSDFRSTALWRPDVVTGDDGRVTVEVTFPDSLTTWRATARAATDGSRFGFATAETRTHKPLIVRLQAPRFFVVGDRVTVSAVLDNHTGEDLTIVPRLDASGVDVVPRADGDAGVTVPAGGERRVDWRVDVRRAGPVTLRVEARGGGHADAMERAYRAFEHGVEKFVAGSGKVVGDDARLSLRLPAERRPGSTALTVRVTPSLAMTLLDALPYLADYPYGCTEQTMSRFLPAVITLRTLERLGLDPGEVASRVFGGVEPEHAERTHPGGASDLGRLDDMVDAGLKRLVDFQHGDGGWGWWKEGDSDPWMTAYVVWGLVLARDAGVDVDRGVLERGARYLDVNLVELEEAPDLQAFALHAASSVNASRRTRPRSDPQAAAWNNLWSRRDELNAYSRALLALSAHYLGEDPAAAVLIRNLENGVRRDDSPGVSMIATSGGDDAPPTAHWGATGLFRRWSDGGVEATAFALRALLAVSPDHPLVEPVTQWLVNNRRGAQWSNTRDTAIAVLALADYLAVSGEMGGTVEYEVRVNGRPAGGGRVTPDNVLDARARFDVDPSWLVDGANEIRVVRRGDGPLYFSAEAVYFSLEEPVTPAGEEIFVRRRYYRRVPRPTLLDGFVEERVPLGDGGHVTTGDRVEVVLTLEARNDYEYLVFEDLKPAGLEAVQLRSGEPVVARELRSGGLPHDPDARDAADFTSRSRGVYQELRDRKVALFLDRLPQGVWELRYELRAETPGSFHALPVLGHAMYVPEVRTNGAEVRIEVDDR